MALDLILRRARIAGRGADPVDIGIGGGRIVAIEPNLAADGPEDVLDGRLVIPGLVETHIHLDKSCIIDRCRCEEGTLSEAIAEVTVAKRAFTEEDVYTRARLTLEKAIVQGTTHLRTHVEVDPRVGLRSFNAIRKLKDDYRWAIDLEICVFPQEGLINDPGTEELLVEACQNGADLIGGCPYTDSHPAEQIARIFVIAKEFDCDIDFHLDFDLDPSWMHLHEVCRQTEQHGWGGRVAIGHVTKLSAISHDALAVVGWRLADSGVAVTVLPATDLFLTGSGHEHSIPRGVAPVHLLREHGVVCSLATNNVLNPFTPFGDCSLIRMANLYANIAQLRRPQDIAGCLDMVTTQAARLMNLPDYAISAGGAADLVLLDCNDAAAAVAELSAPLFALKNGRRTFSRGAAVLNPPC